MKSLKFFFLFCLVCPHTLRWLCCTHAMP